MCATCRNCKAITLTKLLFRVLANLSSVYDPVYRKPTPLPRYTYMHTYTIRLSIAQVELQCKHAHVCKYGTGMGEKVCGRLYVAGLARRYVNYDASQIAEPLKPYLFYLSAFVHVCVCVCVSQSLHLTERLNNASDV
jgi:hypothetical protein